MKEDENEAVIYTQRMQMSVAEMLVALDNLESQATSMALHSAKMKNRYNVQSDHY
jgi:hypothetical protein